MRGFVLDLGRARDNTLSSELDCQSQLDCQSHFGLLAAQSIGESCNVVCIKNSRRHANCFADAVPPRSQDQPQNSSFSENVGVRAETVAHSSLKSSEVVFLSRETLMEVGGGVLNVEVENNQRVRCQKLTQ